eukprot:GEMP01097226.1.p2 GENE.GEMP01097226.1~~GEMP01097226.1.p2  ORF type:complete len:172 (-),score=24.41 GEMP01097226.1:77-592(-)
MFRFFDYLPRLGYPYVRIALFLLIFRPPNRAIHVVKLSVIQHSSGWGFRDGVPRPRLAGRSPDESREHSFPPARCLLAVSTWRCFPMLRPPHAAQLLKMLFILVAEFAQAHPGCARPRIQNRYVAFYLTKIVTLENPISFFVRKKLAVYSFLLREQITAKINLHIVYIVKV